MKKRYSPLTFHAQAIDKTKQENYWRFYAPVVAAFGTQELRIKDANKDWVEMYLFNTDPYSTMPGTVLIWSKHHLRFKISSSFKSFLKFADRSNAGIWNDSPSLFGQIEKWCYENLSIESDNVNIECWESAMNGDYKFYLAENKKNQLDFCIGDPITPEEYMNQ